MVWDLSINKCKSTQYRKFKERSDTEVNASTGTLINLFNLFQKIHC